MEHIAEDVERLPTPDTWQSSYFKGKATTWFKDASASEETKTTNLIRHDAETANGPQDEPVDLGQREGVCYVRGTVFSLHSVRLKTEDCTCIDLKG